MLNTNQSHKRNSWKYTLVIPALIAFLLLFQVHTIAQEREVIKSTSTNSSGIYITTNKNSTDSEMKNDAQVAKEKFGITIKYSKVKRNSKGEITGIKVAYKDKEGNTGTTQFNGKEPIKPIYFYKSGTKIGFGKSNIVNVYNDDSHGEGHGDGHGESYAFSFNDSIPDMANFNFDMEFPEAPEPPEPFELAELGELSELTEIVASPNAEVWSNIENSKIVIKKDGKKPIVIINGKLAEGSENLSKKEIEEIENSIKMNDNGEEETQITINGKDMAKIRKDAMKNAQIQIKRMRPQITAQAREDIERSRPDMDKARAEMEQARAEMLQAKAEMEQAKIELEKAKAALKTK